MTHDMSIISKIIQHKALYNSLFDTRNFQKEQVLKKTLNVMRQSKVMDLR